MATRGMKQKDFGDFFGVSTSSVNNYVNGKAEPPSTLLLEIAREFGISVDDLIGVDMTDKDFVPSSQGSPGEKVIIELLTKEVLRLRAKLKESGVEDAAIDKGFKIAVDQLREEKGE